MRSRTLTTAAALVGAVILATAPVAAFATTDQEVTSSTSSPATPPTEATSDSTAPSPTDAPSTPSSTAAPVESPSPSTAPPASSGPTSSAPSPSTTPTTPGEATTPPSSPSNPSTPPASTPPTTSTPTDPSPQLDAVRAWLMDDEGTAEHVTWPQAPTTFPLPVCLPNGPRTAQVDTLHGTQAAIEGLSSPSSPAGVMLAQGEDSALYVSHVFVVIPKCQEEPTSTPTPTDTATPPAPPVTGTPTPTPPVTETPAPTDTPAPPTSTPAPSTSAPAPTPSTSQSSAAGTGNGTDQTPPSSATGSSLLAFTGSNPALAFGVALALGMLGLVARAIHLARRPKRS